MGRCLQSATVVLSPRAKPFRASRRLATNAQNIFGLAARPRRFVKPLALAGDHIRGDAESRSKRIYLQIGPLGAQQMKQRIDMDIHDEMAQKATLAADVIGNAMEEKLTDMRPAVAAEYDLDDQLVTLAIAKAAIEIAAGAASHAAGLKTDELNDLEDRLYDVIVDVMDATQKGA
jgi:hypothetical protein